MKALEKHRKALGEIEANRREWAISELLVEFRDLSEADATAIYEEVRGPALSPAPGPRMTADLEAVLNVIRPHRAEYDAERADLQRCGKGNAHCFKPLVDVCDSIENGVTMAANSSEGQR